MIDKLAEEYSGWKYSDVEHLYDKYEQFYNRDIAIKYGFKVCIEPGCGKIMEKDKKILDKEVWGCKICKINVCGMCMNLMHDGECNLAN